MAPVLQTWCHGTIPPKIGRPRREGRLLAFARHGKLPAEQVDLNDVVLDVTDLTARLIARGISVVPRLDPNGAPVHINRSQLEQVVMNLVLNARDAIREGPGSIVVTTCNCDSTTVLRVADTGTGMPETVRRRIFEPFFTTRRGGGGTGLGLATVHAIVASAGGTIDVDSKVGVGTVFEIRLPARATRGRLTSAA